MDQNSTLCFRTEDLKKQYETGSSAVHALRGISIEIKKGEFVVMLGPSGSGKSTFLNIIGGLDKPTSGHVYFKNKEISDLNVQELTLFRREHIGFVFQSYNLVPSLTALENVELITEISKNPLNPVNALAAVGLEDRAQHFPSQLSGGEQQRVAIARALAKQPEVLLCDEPTGALDSQTGAIVLQALIDVNKQFGTTCVIITHNESISKLADRIIYFTDGKIVKDELNTIKQSVESIGW